MHSEGDGRGKMPRTAVRRAAKMWGDNGTNGGVKGASGISRLLGAAKLSSPRAPITNPRHFV